MPSPNRRASMRKPARRSVQLHCRRGALGLGPDVAAAFFDVSETGVQLLARDLLKVGDEVELIMEGHGVRGPIRRMGEVRWVVPAEGAVCRAGIRFQKLITYRELQAISV